MELWNGFACKSFLFEEREAYLVFPKQSGEGRYWALKTEYRNAFPEAEIALLNLGFHVAFLKNQTRFATREDCDAKARFAAYLHQTYGLNEKCVPIGMSCGGAHAVNFAGYYPELIQCMFIDAPVLNFLSYPGKLGKNGHEKVWNAEFVKAYPGITRAGLLQFENHPLCHLSILKQHRIPVLMVYGTEDDVVPFEENGRIMELEYADAPDLLCVIPRVGEGHHPHGFPSNPEKITDFILEHCGK